MGLLEGSMGFHFLGLHGDSFGALLLLRRVIEFRLLRCWLLVVLLQISKVLDLLEQILPSDPSQRTSRERLDFLLGNLIAWLAKRSFLVLESSVQHC